MWLAGKGKATKKLGIPCVQGKRTKRPTPKAGPSRDTTITDSVEHLLEDDSSSSEKELWEIVRRKRPHPIQGDGDEEVIVEHEGPPTKKLAMAEAVATPLNKGLRRRKNGRRRRLMSQWRLFPRT